MKFKALLGLVLSLSTSAFALELITPTGLRSDRLYIPTSNGKVVYLDETGRLFSTDLTGSNRKYLSAASQTQPGEGDDETQRLLVLARSTAELAVVEGADASTTVFFQARENPRSFRMFLYRANLDDTSGPTKLFQLVKPLTQIHLSPDSTQLYLAGDDRHSLWNIASAERREVAIRSVPGVQFRISKDFRWVVFVNESRTGGARRFELHAHDLNNGTTRTLLSEMDRSDFQFEISDDSSLVAVQERLDGRQKLIAVAFEGNAVTDIFPLADAKESYEISSLKFMAGVRGEGDPGALLFAAKTYGVNRVFIADLLDLNARALPTREADGETISQFQLSPDSKTLVFQREAINPSSVSPRNYSLDLMDPAARPVFMFESAFSQTSFLADSSAQVFVSSGGFYNKNQIIEVGLDGQSNRVLSAAFPDGWIKASESVSHVAVGPGRSMFMTIYDSTTAPVRYRLYVFERK